MKRWIIISISVLCMGVVSIQAQTRGNCVIDLSAAAATLVQAQAQASSGDTTAAIAKIQELQAQLDVIIRNCDSATTSTTTTSPSPTIPATEIMMPTATPTSPTTPTRFTTSNDLLSVLVPAGWSVLDQGNSVFIGTSEAVAQGLSQFNPPTGDEVGAGFILGTTSQIAPTVRRGGNFVDVLIAYQTQLRQGGYAVSDELTPTTWQDKPAGWFAFQNNRMAGVMQVIELQPDGLHLLILVVSSADNRDSLQTIFPTLVQAIEVNLP